MDKLAQALRDVAEFGTAGFSIDVDPRHQTVEVIISNGPKIRSYEGVFKVGKGWRDSVATALFEATEPFRADWKKAQAERDEKYMRTIETLGKQNEHIEHLRAQLVDAETSREKSVQRAQKLIADGVSKQVYSNTGEPLEKGNTTETGEGFRTGGAVTDTIPGDVGCGVVRSGETFIAVDISGGDENISAVSKEVAAAIAKKS